MFQVCYELISNILEALTIGIYMIWLPFLSIRIFGNWLTNFVNELSFELLVHILLYEDQD